MTIESHTDNDIITLSLDGDFDLFSAKDVKATLSTIFFKGNMKLIMDMTKVEYLDSMGIGCLLYAFSESKRTSTPLLIAGVHGSPQKVIQLTKLDRYFPLIDSLEEAIQQFSE